MMNRIYIVFISLFFVACSSKNYVDILQQENLSARIDLFTLEKGELYLLKKMRIKNNSFHFVSFKIKYLEGLHRYRFNWALRFDKTKKKKYTAFEKNTIKLYPFQEKEVYLLLSLYINLDDDKQKALVPIFTENFDSTKDFFNERQEVEFDYHKFKKEYPTVMEYLLQGYNTIEVKVLKPKEKILYFRNEW